MANTHATTASMTVKIVVNDKGNPPGKLAEAELHFSDGPLAGLKLIGFAVWERRGGSGRNVTFPARQVLGQRRAPELRAVAADRGRHGAGAYPRPRPRGVRRVRSGGFRAIIVVRRRGASRRLASREKAAIMDGMNRHARSWFRRTLIVPAAAYR